MKPLINTTPIRRGAMKARSNVMMRVIMVLMMIVIGLPVSAGFLTPKFEVSIYYTKSGKAYAKLLTRRDVPSGPLVVPESVSEKKDDKVISYPVYAVIATYGQMTSLTIPASVKEAVVNAGHLKSVIFEGDDTKVACLVGETIEEVRLPANLTDFEEFELLDNFNSYKTSFKGCKNLKRITLPKKLKTIRESMFSGCTSLTSIELPETLTKIKQSAFSNSGLTSLTIPEGITSFPDGMCLNCKDLESVTIPHALDSIGYRAFRDCTKLRLAEGNPFPETLTFLAKEAFYGCPSLSENLIVPGTLKDFYMNSFAGCKFNSVTIEEGVENLFMVGMLAKSVSCPKSLKTVQGKFMDSDALETFRFHPDSKIEELPVEGFLWCRNLKNITLPKIKRIVGRTFWECESLEEITLPETLTEIGEYTFNKCKVLRVCNMPTTITKLGRNAFSDCSNLSSNINLPQLEEIGMEAFLRCGSLKNVSLGGSFKNIGSKTFYCSGLENITLPEGVETIGEAAFEYCSELKEMKLPKTLKSIGKDAFHQCENLKTVIMPDNLESIEPYAFAYCAMLENYNLPSTLTSVGDGAFKYSGVKEVVFTNDIPKMGSSIFEYCSSLTKVVYPSTFVTIPNNMFNNCMALTDVTWPKTLNKISSNAFAYVPLASIELPETVTEIDVNAFYANSALTRFVFPKNVKIVKQALARCSNLTEVILPSAATEISNNAFYSTGIKEIIVPEGVTTINSYAFNSCPNLELIVLPSTLTNLNGSEIFAKSPNIKHILSYAVKAPVFEKDYNMFEKNVYDDAKLYTPQDATGYESSCWSRFNRIEAPGVANMQRPTFSTTSTNFTDPITLTLSNPNATGKLYYKVVPEGTEGIDVAYSLYTEPIEISASCKVWAYVVDGYNASDYVYSLYTYVPPIVHHLDVVVAGIEVNDKNAADVLGDGKVSYDSKEQVLTLKWADINVDEKTYSAAIQADDGDLTIRVEGHCTLTASAYGLLIGAYPGFGGRGANVTIVGDENSILTINTNDKSGDGIYSYLGNVTIENCTVVVNAGYTGLFMKSGPEDGILTMKGKNAMLNLTGGQDAMANVQMLVLDKMLGIIEPEEAVYKYGSIWLDGEPQNHVVIAAKKLTEDITVPNMREDYETNFETDLFDNETGSIKNLNNVVINNVYYNLPPSNGYDYGEECIVVYNTMSEDEMTGRDIPTDASEPANFDNWYNGIVLVINSGGSIDINYQTQGDVQLGVKVGEEDCQYFTTNTQDVANVHYNVNSPQYVYIYAAENNTEGNGEDVDKKENAAKAHSVAPYNYLRLYGFKVTHAAPSGIENIGEATNIDQTAIYNIQGVRVARPTAPGIYIVNGKKMVMK